MSAPLNYKEKVEDLLSCISDDILLNGSNKGTGSDKGTAISSLVIPSPPSAMDKFKLDRAFLPEEVIPIYFKTAGLKVEKPKRAEKYKEFFEKPGFYPDSRLSAVDKKSRAVIKKDTAMPESGLEISLEPMNDRDSIAYLEHYVAFSSSIIPRTLNLLKKQDVPSELFVELAERTEVLENISIGYFVKTGLRDVCFIGSSLLDSKFYSLADVPENMQKLNTGNLDGKVIDWLLKRYEIVGNVQPIMNIITETNTGQFVVSDIKDSTVDHTLSSFYLKNPRELAGFFKRVFSPEEDIITKDIKDVKKILSTLEKTAEVAPEYKPKISQLLSQLEAVEESGKTLKQVSGIDTPEELADAYSLTAGRDKTTSKAVLTYLEDCVNFSKIGSLSVGVFMQTFSSLWQAGHYFDHTLFRRSEKIEPINDFDIKMPFQGFERNMARTLNGHGALPEDFALTSLSDVLMPDQIIQIGTGVYNALTLTGELLEDMYAETSKIKDLSKVKKSQFLDDFFKVDSNVTSRINIGIKGLAFFREHLREDTIGIFSIPGVTIDGTSLDDIKNFILLNKHGIESLPSGGFRILSAEESSHPSEDGDDLTPVITPEIVKLYESAVLIEGLPTLINFSDSAKNLQEDLLNVSPLAFVLKLKKDGVGNKTVLRRIFDNPGKDYLHDFLKDKELCTEVSEQARLLLENLEKQGINEGSISAFKKEHQEKESFIKFL